MTAGAPGVDAGCFALRGATMTSIGDPFSDAVERTRRYESDGVVVVDDGMIVDAGPAADVLRRLPSGVRVERLPERTLLAAGFIDCHVHYAQLPVIASPGTQLLDWLDRYTFPAEQALADGGHARAAASSFFDQALACGTTTMVSFCTTHAHSVDAFFEAAQQRGMRAVGGKVLMDRNAPPALCDTAQRGYDESRALISRWQGRGRLGYAITPRFAPSCSEAQLRGAGELAARYRDVWIQSHVAENRREVAWVRELHPERRHYVDVYAHYGLLGPRAIYGHGIHLSDDELGALARSGTALAHCPTSNLFLGSGLFPWRRVKKRGRPLGVGLGSDVGGGTSLSMLATGAEAYKVAQMGGVTLSAAQLFHLATRGGAQALGLHDRIGSLLPGVEADLVLLDLAATPMLAQRTHRAESIDEALFALFMLGDDRAVRATYVAGRCVHRRDA